jgi:hypothetical protein
MTILIGGASFGATGKGCGKSLPSEETADPSGLKVLGMTKLMDSMAWLKRCP